MRTLIIVVSLFALFFSAAGYLRVTNPDLYYSFQQAVIDPTHQVKKSDDNLAEPGTGVATVSPVDINGNSTLPPASYEDYAPEKLVRAETAPVILFFHASWCPSCISTDRIFKKKISTLPQGYLVLRIDYDTATALKERYGITYQHTFVQVDPRGKEITRWSGGAIDGIIANVVQ